MLEINYIRQNPELVKVKLGQKYFNNTEIIDQILDLDKGKREIQQQQQELQNESNRLSKEFGILMSKGQKEDAELNKSRAIELKTEVKQLEEQLKSLEDQLFGLLTQLPNLPAEIVPPGKTPEENLEVKTGGKIPDLTSSAQPHWELLEKYNLVNLALGVKLTGAGFPVFIGKGAKLQRALVAFFLDEAIKAGYQEIIPPLLVNSDSAFATGQLPDKEGQMYYVTEDELYLIPTAEVPVTNIYRDEIVEEKNLPIKLCGHSQCFRRESGSYGKDVRGLNRVHQFEKVEIVQIAHPENSYQVLAEMVEHVEGILNKLELPWRILRLCGGDMSFASALTYDFEVYSTAQKRWLEVSSVSNFETFQSNRLKLRMKSTEGKNRLCHTLNGSALALPRIIAGLLENNQTADGIKIPKALVPYTGFDMIN